MRKLKSTYCLLLFVAIVMKQWTVTFAQKLPGVQTSSLWAPENLKIDGKTTEWNGTFQAYNKAADIFYTISNDDKNIGLFNELRCKMSTMERL